jgi:hypothetical protein
MPVAVLESTAVGYQSTITFEGSPPSLEVMADFDNPMMQSGFAGNTLKEGKDTALFDPPIVKSEEPEEVVVVREHTGGFTATETVKLEITVAFPLILILTVRVTVWAKLIVEVLASACIVAPLISTVIMGLPVGKEVYSYWQPKSRNFYSRIVGLTRLTTELYSPWLI